MTRRFFSGRTLDQAVMMAARHYKIDPEQLAYRQIEKRHGFLRARRAVVIAVDPDQPRREPPPAAEATAPPPAAAPEPEAPQTSAVAVDPAPEAPSAWQEPLPAEPAVAAKPARASTTEEAYAAAARDTGGDDELPEAAERATHILLQFAGIDAQASARSGPERIEVEVRGPDDSVLVVEEGKGLLAIQHLLPRMLRGLTGRSSYVRVDSDGFHQHRRDRLETLARKEADQVSQNGRSRTLAPMAPDERRIVHLALRDSPAVVTESRGSGLHKRVVIRPAGGDDEREDAEPRDRY